MQGDIRKKKRMIFDCSMSLRYLMLFVMLAICGANPLHAQRNSIVNISGLVTDSNGEPIIGATVVVSQGSTGAITDIDGKYSIQAKQGDTIEVSYLGFRSANIEVEGAKTTYDVELESDSYQLSDVVVIGYGKQRKETVVGAVVQLSAEDVVQTPVANLSNALNGRLPGVVTMQRSGQPGDDDAQIYIRGQATLGGYASAKPLILVDGVERDFNQIDANEIESMSVLKDASATAVYGVRGANGVILVTTRRGTEGDANVSFSYQYGLQSPTSFPNTLGSVDYATLYQEAYFNDTRLNNGIGKMYYSQAELDAIKRVADGKGSDYEKMRYPNTNWADELVRNITPQTQANLNISGGTDRIRYFASVGYLNQTSLFKEDEFDEYIIGEKNYSSNFIMNRYNFRTNFDIDVARNLLLKVNLGGRIEKTNSPNESAYTLMQLTAYGATPFQTMFYPGKGYPAYGGTNNVFANYLQGGFRDSTESTVESTAVLDYDFKDYIPGLRAHANISFDSYFSYTKSFYQTPPLFDLDTHFDYPVYVAKNIPMPLSSGNDWYYNNNKLYFETGVDYAKSFDEHELTAMALYNLQQYRTAADIPYVYMGVVGRVTYAYNRKYLAEINIGYNGSENFAPGKRFGLFPALSVGWVVSEESFMKDNISWINWLKIRASYGEVGNDKIGDNRFLYYSDYNQFVNKTQGNGAVEGVRFGPNYYNTPMIIEGRIGNTEVTWERAKKSNVGLDINLFDNRLAIVADVFSEYRNGLLIDQSASTPTIFGAELPAVNKGKTKNYGYELEATYRDKIGKDFNYWIKGNYCFARNEVLFVDEPASTAPWQKQEGYPIGQPLLYECVGFFNSFEEVANYDQSEVFDAYGPGDRKYADKNGDGIVSPLDMHRPDSDSGVYTPIPEITYGINLGLSYKGFDASVLLNGVAHVSIAFSDQAIEEFTSNVQDFHLNRWSPFATNEQNANATFPALHVNRAMREINRVGSYGEKGSIFRADYLRLKNVELGYTFPKRWTNALQISSIRVYANGNNLALLYDAVKLVDPESNGGNGLFYPQMKVYNMGVNIKF